MSEFSPLLRMSIILYVHCVYPQVCAGLYSLYMKRSEDTGFCLLLLLTLFFETGPAKIVPRICLSINALHSMLRLYA